MKKLFKSWLAPIIYRFPPIGLQPERLYLYMDAIWKTKDTKGDIVEIGCSMGGTAAVANNMQRRLGMAKRYRCYDTFNGFVPEQIEHDLSLGTRTDQANLFKNNDASLVRKVVDRHHGQNIELFVADIAKVADKDLPDLVSCCLIDVDLAIPTYEGLKKIYPRLAPGGIIVVDDCESLDKDSWKARLGYQQFIEEFGLASEIVCDMGIVRKPLAEVVTTA